MAELGTGLRRLLAFLTSPRSRKARNVERDPRVCVSLTDSAQPFAMTQAGIGFEHYSPGVSSLRDGVTAIVGFAA